MKEELHFSGKGDTLLTWVYVLFFDASIWCSLLDILSMTYQLKDTTQWKPSRNLSAVESKVEFLH